MNRYIELVADTVNRMVGITRHGTIFEAVQEVQADDVMTGGLEEKSADQGINATADGHRRDGHSSKKILLIGRTVMAREGQAGMHSSHTLHLR